jgi:pyruvate formate lyase activating enzyme
MTNCYGCNAQGNLISETIGLCRDCIEDDFERHHAHLEGVHRRVRADFDMPLMSPREPDGLACDVCARSCSMIPGQSGYCSVRHNIGGDIAIDSETAGAAYVELRHDPLPGSCGASFACPGCSAAGFPKYSYSRGAESGYKCLVVNYNSCNFNCLFCQHWSFREKATAEYLMTPEQVVQQIDDSVACLCFTGGDSAPQIEHALQVAELAARETRGRILRLCWETNGSQRHSYIQRIARLAFESGGLIKIELKAFSPKIHYALCGISNRQVLNNFRALQKVAPQRPETPLAAASTVLVPGYITPGEIWRIGQFMASRGSETPYALLAFFPHFYLNDLPSTSREHADAALEAALDSGLKKLHIGNKFFIEHETYI